MRIRLSLISILLMSFAISACATSKQLRPATSDYLDSVAKKNRGGVSVVLKNGWTWNSSAYSTFKYDGLGGQTPYFCSNSFCAAYRDIAEVSYASGGASLGDVLSGGGLATGILIVGLPVVAISELGDLVDDDQPKSVNAAVETVDVEPDFESDPQRQLRADYEARLNEACYGSEKVPDASIRSSEARRLFVTNYARELSGHCLSFLVRTRWGLPETGVSMQVRANQFQVFHALKALGNTRLAWEAAHCDGVFIANYNPIRELSSGEMPFKYDSIEFNQQTIDQVISLMNDPDLFSYEFDFAHFCETQGLGTVASDMLERRQEAVLELFSPFRRHSTLRLNGSEMELSGHRGRMFPPNP